VISSVATIGCFRSLFGEDADGDGVRERYIRELRRVAKQSLFKG
jgi:hypothetical protein